MDSIFNNHTTLEGVDRYGNKGTGQGLYNINSSLKEIGGKIAVISSPGEGSKFTFHLPAY